MKTITISYKEWREEAKKRYPDDNIVFRCPVCGFRQSVSEYKVAGAPEGSWGFSCIGRWTGAKRLAFGAGKKSDGPCDYAGGGLFAVNPIQVVFSGGLIRAFFDFADRPLLEVDE
ncbi:MAG: VVA0879 family protein [Candidatus Neomarinimicrobiota bacterium]|jgi:hypothetical protein